jgi:hypothetical protein
MIVHRVRGLLVAALSMLAFGIATLAPATAAVQARHHHHRHHVHHRIPQHNGGDHDADNNGGPSDGDGNV